MKRSFLVLSLVALLGSLLVPAAVEAGKPVDQYCSPSGDYCTTVQRGKGDVFFILRTFSFSNQYKLCVDPPHTRRECGYWQLSKGKHGVYASRVSFRGHYPTNGPGRYQVTWYYGGKTRLGPPLYFGKN